MPTYLYKCEACPCTEEVLCKYEDRQESVHCTGCGHRAHLTMMGATVMRASYPDGHKRKGWNEIRTASKLNKQAAVESNPETKKQMVQEIKKMASIRKQEG